MKNIKYGFSVAVCVMVIIFGVSLSFAGEDEIAKLQTRIAQLQEEIENNGKEYQGIASSIATDRAHCELASAKEAQLSRLNGSNNAKRTEIEILNQLLQGEDSPVKLGK